MRHVVGAAQGSGSSQLLPAVASKDAVVEPALALDAHAGRAKSAVAALGVRVANAAVLWRRKLDDCGCGVDHEDPFSFAPRWGFRIDNSSVGASAHNYQDRICLLSIDCVHESAPDGVPDRRR